MLKTIQTATKTSTNKWSTQRKTSKREKNETEKNAHEYGLKAKKTYIPAFICKFEKILCNAQHTHMPTCDARENGKRRFVINYGTELIKSFTRKLLISVLPKYAWELYVVSVVCVYVGTL